MSKKKEKKYLNIISNEKFFTNKSINYCDNIDLKTIPEGLVKFFNVTLIARKSKIYRSQKVQLKNFKLAENIFIYINLIYKSLKERKSNYLVISITPYTFLACLVLFLFRQKVLIYLRSDGHKEYKIISGSFGSFLYSVMFTIISWKASFVTCGPHLLKKKKKKIVYPSQLDNRWVSKRTKPPLKKINLLYVGRLNVEKGIFSRFKILSLINKKLNLTVVYPGKNVGRINENKNIKFLNFNKSHSSLMNVYDKHNIFVLPSFTESYSQVIDESISRLRPVIIFKEISHIIGYRKGVYISKRDEASFLKKINFIIKNYNSIQKKMRQNVLPTKEIFLKEMAHAIRKI